MGIATLFVLVIVMEVLFALKFHFEAKGALAESERSDSDIFGRKYKSELELYADFNFLNDLFEGKKIEAVTNESAKKHLVTMRRVFLYQVIGGLAFLSLGIIYGLMSQ